MRLRPLLVVVGTAAVMTFPITPASAAGVPHVLTSGAVGTSRQVVMIAAAASSSTTAYVSWWLRAADGSWHLARNGVAARIGVHGMAASKREGDGTTPIGVFPATLAFGWYGNPGTKLAWRQANSDSRWVDDSSSAYYNRWMQAPANGRWDSAERLRITPYTYALDLGYNRAHTPGKGSAIFLHLNTGRATSGCVTVDQTTVLTTIRWLDPTLHPVFVIGTNDWIARH